MPPDIAAPDIALTAARADRFKIMGYTKEMPDLMGAATLLLSKPGGLTTAEALARLAIARLHDGIDG